MTRQELKEKVNDAYSRYLDKIDALATRVRHCTPAACGRWTTTRAQGLPRQRIGMTSCTNRMFSIRNTSRVTEGSMLHHNQP